jgi:hypothetical protein
MSKVIEVLKAFNIVRGCCHDHSPSSQVVGQLRTIISAIIQAIPQEPAQAGTPTLPGAGIIEGLITRVTPGQVPVLPLQPLPTPSTVTLADWQHAITTLRGLQDRLESELDICTPMLGCVAEGFRKSQLGADNGPRMKLVEKGWVQHYLPAPKRFPSWVQHTKRP